MGNALNDFDKVRQAIDDFAKSIAEEVANIRYYEVDRIKAVASTRLNMAIQELLQMHLFDLEQEKADLVAAYLDLRTPNWKKERLKKEIAGLNVELKKSRRLKCTFGDYSEYQQLRHYLKEGIGQQVLDDFEANYLNKNGNEKHIMIRESSTTPSVKENGGNKP
jgi:hypothetical protein